ncbi:MAG: hypothetical protein IKL20_07925 [Alistipes sp.]|nr:hypothetical protein [Alistipes sp.]
MKQQIDNLIANLLLDEGEVFLPKVGTLILYRHATKRLSSSKMQRSFRELRLTAEKRGVNIALHIAKIASISEERATDIYTEWFEQSMRNEVLSIGGVCIIKDGKIETDNTFENMANPKGRNVIEINPRPNYLIYILLGVLIGLILGAYGFYHYASGSFDNMLKGQTIIPTSEVLTEASSEKTTPAEADVVAEPATTTEQPADEVEKGAKDVVEQTTEQTTEPMAVESAESKAEPSAKAEITKLKRGYSYAVWGVYRELKNAEEAIEWLSEKFPDLKGNIYRHGERYYMVTLFEYPSRSKCQQKVAAWKREHRNSSRNVWVHTQS